jgi:hypothetical protein
VAKKKRGILRREKITVDGVEIEVDTFDAKVILGSGTELESIDELLREEETDKAIHDALTEIETIAKGYAGKEKDVWYYYKAGKILQFVDDEGLTDIKGLIWHRMAHDLCPDLFGGKKKNAQESKRYPETMYHLGKQLERNVGRANFEQWYEIVKFKDIYTDKDLLEQILGVCEQGLSSVQLRQQIKELRASKSKAKSGESC